MSTFRDFTLFDKISTQLNDQILRQFRDLTTEQFRDFHLELLDTNTPHRFVDLYTVKILSPRHFGIVRFQVIVLEEAVFLDLPLALIHFPDYPEFLEVHSVISELSYVIYYIPDSIFSTIPPA